MGFTRYCWDCSTASSSPTSHTLLMGTPDPRGGLGPESVAVPTNPTSPSPPCKPGPGTVEPTDCCKDAADYGSCNPLLLSPCFWQSSELFLYLGYLVSSSPVTIRVGCLKKNRRDFKFWYLLKTTLNILQINKTLIVYRMGKSSICI